MITSIINVIVITMNSENEVFPDGFIQFKNDKITLIGDRKDYVKPAECEEIDGKRGILMPGMINLHSHLGMIPFRGLQDDCVDRLRKFLLPMEKAEMSPELVYASTKYALSEMLLGGITTVMDMYYFEKETARAAQDMSIRAFLGETIIDEGACDFENPYESLEYAEEFIQQYQNHPLITPCIAPHSTTTCSEDVLCKAHELSRKYSVPLTMHISEMDYEIQYFMEKYQMSPIAYMNHLGIVDDRLVAAHCIYMNDGDFAIMKGKNASVAHCIGSNTKAAKGIAPVKDMIEHGITVGLGTDGPASGNTLDIITQFKLFADFHKNINRDRSLFPASSIVAMGTINGAKALHIDEYIGSLEAGKQADIVLLETESVNMFPIYDPYSTLVYSANSSNVSMVFVAGKCVVKDKKLKEHNLKDLREELMNQMMQRENNLFQEHLL
ncbi:amidohydrolase [[Clostridium] fimetarium]|uniref:Cytosine/adenosine deaminase n=1 Tax=[Clostridium] fimetarium TaxID=99656 RepID=A0A1I0N4N2_9FIRM|nr:amidohydrolase [[Clostridium] fimetarium]SEV96033.1 Cytosine/adenosine deaminase [[Clostridium] fimetarium]